MAKLRIPLDLEPAAAIDVALRRTPSRRRFLRGLVARVFASSRVREAALYAGAGVSYVTAGVFVTELALTWIVGFAWLLAWVCGLPALGRRLRR